MLTRAMILRAAILSVVAYAIGLPVSDSLNALEKSAQSHCSPNCGTKSNRDRSSGRMALERS